MGIYTELNENSSIIMQIKLKNVNYTYLRNIMHHSNKLKNVKLIYYCKQKVNKLKQKDEREE
jgi:hypothetical protein